MKKVYIIIFFFIINGCSEIEFVYDKKNFLNPLYGKTEVSTDGVDLTFLKSYIPMFFGETNRKEFTLAILIEEEQTKRSVETNQVTSNLQYEIRFFYTLSSIEEKCLVYEKQILTSFSIIPKSSGFNYGTDTSLEKKYELAITQNLNQFISFLSNVSLDRCL